MRRVRNPRLGRRSKLAEILHRGILRVGTTGDYRPFTYLDKTSGAYSGLDVDLAHSLADALGVKVEFVATSWPTLAKDFDADLFDIAMGGVSITLERAKTGCSRRRICAKARRRSRVAPTRTNMRRSTKSTARASRSSSIPAGPTSGSTAPTSKRRRSSFMPITRPSSTRSHRGKAM